MALGRRDEAGPWLLAPVPHGAAFDPASPGTVSAPLGTSVPVAAAARFQQMALLGLNRAPAGTGCTGALVLGSGPVALGCVLELRRRGAAEVRVVTSRERPPIATVPGVECLRHEGAGTADTVIDTTGAPERALPLLAPGGVLGLLGTPFPRAELPALAVHRNGWTVVGMQELAPAAPDAYRSAYATAAAWLTENVGPGVVARWCRIVPGSLAPEVFRQLRDGGRLAEPVVIFDWEAE
ncbi:hypothetical protein DEH69_06310 [Streptomyces sp. PT12]|nr:hypothetical protein DEH69_06310 [Streptomyces sp. PT12]